LYFAEVELVDSKHERMFIVSAKRNSSWLLLGNFDYLVTAIEYKDAPFPFVSPQDNYIMLKAANATALRPLFNINGTVLPPFINAAELFSPISTADVGTDAQDGKYEIVLMLFLVKLRP
jgi:hypothetical protein